MVLGLFMQHKLAQGIRATHVRQRAGARRWEWLAIGAIALTAFAIRAWTVRLNLPYVGHPDEPNPINYVVAMLRSGDPNPHFFQKPSLYVYLLLAVLVAHYRWGLAHGIYGAIDQMTITTHLYTTIPGFFFWGRMLTVSIATLTVVSVFLLGRRVWNLGAGLIAALFVALSPFHMRHSQYVTTDVTTAWLVLLVFGASIAVARGGRWRDYLAAGVLVGLAASTKYNAGVAALMVLVAHLIYYWRQRSSPVPVPNSQFSILNSLPRLLAAGAAAVLGFLAGTPYALLSFGEFRRGLLGQVQDYGETTHGDFTGAWNLRGYLSFFWHDGIGPIACIAVLAGLALLLWRSDPHNAVEPISLRHQGMKNRATFFKIYENLASWRLGGFQADTEQAPAGRAAGLIWLSFVVPYVLLHAAQSSHFTRNMVAVVVLSALPIGVAASAVAEKVKGKRLKASEFKLFALYLLPFALLAALLLPSALETWGYSMRLRRGDTRLQALDWIDANVPPGVRIAAELRSLPGPSESRWAEAPTLLAHDLAWYRRQGYGYVVASSDTWRQWAIPAAYQEFAAGAPLAEFGGDDPRDMLGPHLAIYATGLAAADAPERLGGEARIGGARLAGIALGLPVAKAPALGLQPARQVKPGQTLALRTFWSIEQPLDADFFIFVHVIDAAGNTVAQRDAPPWQGRFPTSSWRPGSVVVDVDDLALPAGLPPGTYTIALGMFDPANGGHPPMTVDGQAVGAIEVGQISIK
jgi:4-amino-4-deoxy-L-arabinose transferase-like glycosyltransferase